MYLFQFDYMGSDINTVTQKIIQIIGLVNAVSYLNFFKILFCKNIDNVN